MSGPVSPPLATTESGTSTIVRPTNTLEFNGADFTVTGSGSKATISLDSTGAGAALTATQIGYGDSSNLLTGSSLLTYDDTAGSELVTIKGSGTSTLLKLESTEAGGAVSPILDLFRNSASPATGDDLGQILFSGNDSAGAKQNYFQIKGEIRDKTSGSDDGELIFIGPSNSTDIEFVRMSKTVGVVVNEGGGGIVDFRVETSNNVAILCSDASNDNLGVGTSSPDSNSLLHITDDGTKTNTVMIESTDNSATVGPNVQFLRNSGSPAVSDEIGSIQFVGKDDGGNDTTYAQIKTSIQDETGGTEDGWLQFGASFAGTLQPNMLTIRGDVPAVVVNEGSGDVDFRVEGNGDVNLITTDGANDNVGIGRAPDSSAAKLQIDVGNSTQRALDLISDDSDADAAPTLRFQRISGSPAVQDAIGEIEFGGKDSGANSVVYGRISSHITDPTDGSEDGDIRIKTIINGSENEFVRFNNFGVIFNELSVDQNFKIESNGNANMFTVDGGNNLVSVGSTVTAGGATFQVPDNTISHYCNVNAIRSDAVGIMVMVNEDNQGQMWVHESASAHTIQLPEGGVKGMHFQFMSTDGNITVDPQGSDTLNGGTASLTRSTNFEIYDVFCYDTGKWALSNPA